MAGLRPSTTLVLALALGGCYSGLDRGGSGQGDDADDADASGDDAGTQGSDDPPSPDTALIEARVRRLSATEYRAMIVALLGDAELAATLPPDPIVGGYDNDAASLRVNGVVAQALWAATPELAAQLAANELAASPCAGDERACAEQILTKVASRAYRRPIADDELAELLEVYDLGRQDADLGAGLELALRVVLQSPQFLYRTELGDGDDASGAIALTDDEIAQALAFATTGAPPDDALLELAAQGQLRDASVRAEQAERLLSTPGAAALIGDFATQWLEARELPTTARDAALYPDFDVVKPSAATELRDFVARAILDEGAGYSELLLADWTIADDVMATFYGVDTPGRITRPEGRAAGVLALPGFLAAHAQFQDPSPVQRGHFVRARLLCQPLPPPPNDVVVAPPPPDPSLSNRQRWFQKTNDPSCQACHSLMDPLGFAFENFDASGQWRATDAGAPVDASGAIAGTDVDGEFMDLEGMAKLLADSDIARRCFASHWLEYSLAKSLTPDEAATVAELVDAFATDEATVRDLIVSVLASDAFVWRSPTEQD